MVRGNKKGVKTNLPSARMNWTTGLSIVICVIIFVLVIWLACSMTRHQKWVGIQLDEQSKKLSAASEQVRASTQQMSDAVTPEDTNTFMMEGKGDYIITRSDQPVYVHYEPGQERRFFLRLWKDMKEAEKEKKEDGGMDKSTPPLMVVLPPAETVPFGTFYHFLHAPKEELEQELSTEVSTATTPSSSSKLPASQMLAKWLGTTTTATAGDQVDAILQSAMQAMTMPISSIPVPVAVEFRLSTEKDQLLLLSERTTNPCRSPVMILTSNGSNQWLLQSDLGDDEGGMSLSESLF
jgi:hypothetical protein